MEYNMTVQRKHLIALLVSALTAGVVLAQAPGGNMMGGTNNNMMGGTRGSQSMAGQMMNPEMIHGLSGTMTQMHQMMQQMAATVEHHGRGMGPQSMADMSKMMEEMGGMMQNMAAGMREGKIDHGMFKTMNEQMDVMGKSIKHMKTTH
jgi:methyl-accepting chemotaxis protein